MSELHVKQGLSRRQFLVNSALFSSALAMMACAPGSDGAAVEAEPAEAPAAPADDDSPDIGQYGGDGTPVTVWHGLGVPMARPLRSCWRVMQKNSIQPIRSETYAWDVFFQKFPTAVAAGTPPDMAIFHAAEIPQMADQA